MQVRPGSVKPSLDIFRQGVAAHEQAQRAETQDFEQRRRVDNEVALDRAIREGVAAEQARSQQPVAAPAPPAAPATQMVSIAPDTGGDTEIGPLVEERPLGNAAPQQPAIGGFTARGPSALMSRLTQTPGAGATVLALHNQNQKARDAAEVQTIKALHGGEPEVAATIARQYGINIPEEVIRNTTFQREMKQLGATIKALGVSDDLMAVNITRDYLAARQAGADERVALEQAMGKAKATVKPPATTWSPTHNAFVEHPSADHPQGRALQPPALPARQVGGNRPGGGGGGSRQLEYAQWRIKTLVSAGVPEQQAQQIVAGGVKGPTSLNAAQIAARLFNTTDDAGNRIYPNYQAALTAARNALGMPAPSPAARPSLDSFGGGGAAARPSLDSFNR